MPVQSNVLTTELQSLVTNAGAAVADLSGIVSGADVLASQFDALKNAMQDLADLAGVLRNSGFYTPVGCIVPFGGVVTAGSNEPDGWFLCDGRAWGVNGAPSNTSALYSVISGAFPSGLPDLRGRVIAGVDSTGLTDADANPTRLRPVSANAASLGFVVGDLRLQDHTHTYSGETYDPTSGSASKASISAVPGTVGGTFSFLAAYTDTGPPNYNSSKVNHSHGYGGTTSSNSGNKGVAQNIPPTMVMHYLIKG